MSRDCSDIWESRAWNDATGYTMWFRDGSRAAQPRGSGPRMTECRRFWREWARTGPSVGVSCDSSDISEKGARNHAAGCTMWFRRGSCAAQPRGSAPA
ncbi:hypothetical protein GCM10009860_20770 [Microbacterium mitrae]